MSFHTSKLVKTRKAHRCFGCSKLFPPGRILYKQSWVFQGEFAHGYMCQKCEKHLNKYHNDYCLDGFMQGTLREDRHEAIKEWRLNRKPNPPEVTT